VNPHLVGDVLMPRLILTITWDFEAWPKSRGSATDCGRGPAARCGAACSVAYPLVLPCISELAQPLL